MSRLGGEIGRERNVEQTALPRRIDRRHAGSGADTSPSRVDDPNPARAFGHQHPSIGKERESSRDRRDRSRRSQPRCGPDCVSTVRGCSARARVLRDESTPQRQERQRDCPATVPPQLQLCVCGSSSRQSAVRGILAAVEAFPLHEAYQICLDPAPMVVERPRTKTASGSDGWKRRGRAMPSNRISAVLACRRAR